MEVNEANLARPVDWRLKIAQESAESGKYLAPGAFDQITRRAADYLSRRRRLTGTEQPHLTPSMPDVSWAIATHEEAAAIRAELEARLLTDECLASIGDGLGATRQAIATYAVLCFDVKSRLDQTGFIHQTVIAAAIAAGRYQEAFLKLVGYYCGRKALGHLLGRKRPTDIDKLINDLSRRADLFWKFRASQLAAEVASENGMSARQVLDAVAMVDRREAIAGSDSQIQDNLQAMLVAMGPSFQAVGIADVPTEGADSFAAELRTDELPFWALNLLTPDRLTQLAESKFPQDVIERAKNESY